MANTRSYVRRPYAFYGYSEIGSKETFHLHCPACAAEEIEVVEEALGGGKHLLGDLARCWICKHEFRVTENCWKRVVW